MRIISLLISTVGAIVLTTFPQDPCTTVACKCTPDYKIGNSSAGDTDPNGTKDMNEPQSEDYGTASVTINGDDEMNSTSKEGQSKGVCKPLFGTCTDCPAKKCKWSFSVSFNVTGLDLLPDEATLRWGIEDAGGGDPTYGSLTFNPTQNSASGGSTGYIDHELPCYGINQWVTKEIAIMRTDVNPDLCLFRLQISYKCDNCPNTPQ